MDLVPGFAGYLGGGYGEGDFSFCYLGGLHRIAEVVAGEMGGS